MIQIQMNMLSIIRLVSSKQNDDHRNKKRSTTKLREAGSSAKGNCRKTVCEIFFLSGMQLPQLQRKTLIDMIIL